jgi:rare lipoprotein A (peptidoglycan hydrolase)
MTRRATSVKSFPKIARQTGKANYQITCLLLSIFLSFIAPGCATVPSSSKMVNTIPLRPDFPEKDAPEAIAPRIQKPSPTPMAKVYTGEASWYGPGFHGKKTASGEIYDQAKFTAAHRTFPLGSRAKVTHLQNGKSVEVEINDRGPYADGRIIDLSRAAASALDMIENGTAAVRVELIAEPSAAR